MLDKKNKQQLVQAARDSLENAYAPYSNYKVGAAVLTGTGKIVCGANVENAVYPLTVCAERAAVFSAVSEGERNFIAIAVATKDGGSPCGSCRQVLAEFGLDILVIVADTEGKVYYEKTVEQLLPESFGPTNLIDKTN